MVISAAIAIPLPAPAQQPSPTERDTPIAGNTVSNNAVDDIVDVLDQYVPLGKQALYVLVQTITQSVEVSPEQEMEVGEQYHQALKQQLGTALDGNPQDLAYANALGQRLIQNVERQGIRYQFHVVDEDTINAFAIPGGHIFINQGLLRMLKNEAEYAAVLGHEIGHVDAQHGLDYAKVIVAADQLPIPDQAKVLTALAGRLVTQAYTEAQEIDADSRGTLLAFADCYDPRESAKFWQRMSQEEGTGSSDTVTGVVTILMRSHPPSAKRAVAIEAQSRELIAQNPNQPLAIGESNYRQRAPLPGCSSTRQSTSSPSSPSSSPRPPSPSANEGDGPLFLRRRSHNWEVPQVPHPVFS